MNIDNTPSASIGRVVGKQKAFFATGATRDMDFRIGMLRRLADALHRWEKPLCEALREDLHKSREEAYMTEIGIVLTEIRQHLKHIRKWTRPRRAATPLTLFPSSSRMVSEPLGNVLIVAPWNYPVQLLLNPLVGAISAGCTAVLKPSPYVPHVSLALEAMLKECFNEEYIAVIQGNRDVNTELFRYRYDLIFLTGSPSMGRIAMKAAAEHLTPVILELGGKSPCIVDRDADIATAARRIAWGKCLNAGQTCIAPDYLLLHRDIKEAFITAFSEAVRDLYGSENLSESPHYVRIVNDRAFDRLISYLKDGDIVSGGRYDRESRFMEPTLLDNVSKESPVMTEEIFGPILPVNTFGDIGEAVQFINGREKPLALYYFGKPSAGKKVIACTSSGGACVNDVIMHIANHNIPFGGVGNSGIGNYHGRRSFEAFSHLRSVLTTPLHPDMPFRYMPYRWFSLIRMLMR